MIVARGFIFAAVVLSFPRFLYILSRMRGCTNTERFLEWRQVSFWQSELPPHEPTTVQEYDMAQCISLGQRVIRISCHGSAVMYFGFAPMLPITQGLDLLFSVSPLPYSAGFAGSAAPLYMRCALAGNARADIPWGPVASGRA